ncbi:DegT/DnrJ/EryC1/StrS family aminotransferase [Azospirillum sp. ST 5-10]|uniref:DegT/DnrJ/EryC1/StrS family aminotransferase n=1 Tax=unclassified Azospirillum TaxID=2630922 RepID=UPI003F4A2929
MFDNNETASRSAPGRRVAAGDDMAVFRPRLPAAAKILPYLEEIDANRWYTNNGPLLQRFERGLAAWFGVPPERVVAVASATAGLSLCLLSAGASPGGLCILPSWTHEASAVAAVRAGLTPWLHDVDEATWQLDPAAVADSVRRQPRVTSVLVTAPFGAAVDPAPWAALAERSGVSVVIDAAGGFDGTRGGAVDTVVSLHATKVFGIGEGGVVIARDAARAERLRTLARLGLSADRTVAQAGMNAKLSEYGAAVGLAALDEWPQRRTGLRRLRAAYAARFGSDGPIRPWLPDGVSSTVVVRLPRPTVVATAEALRRRGIGTRLWWHRGCHRQPAFADLPRQALPVTEALADSVLGLPFHDDLDGRDVDRVVAALLDVVAQPA